MSTLWVICGAGRGVGKTHVATRLCHVLPNAVYAKHGCGKERGDKADNYFRTRKSLVEFLEGRRDCSTHLVAESNTMAAGGEGDVIIYLEALPAQTGIRDDVDELRARAHIRVGETTPGEEWEEILCSVLPDPDQRRQVSEILHEQQRRRGIEPAVDGKPGLLAGDTTPEKMNPEGMKQD